MINDFLYKYVNSGGYKYLLLLEFFNISTVILITQVSYCQSITVKILKIETV